MHAILKLLPSFKYLSANMYNSILPNNLSFLPLMPSLQTSFSLLGLWCHRWYWLLDFWGRHSSLAVVGGQVGGVRAINILSTGTVVDHAEAFLVHVFHLGLETQLVFLKHLVLPLLSYFLVLSFYEGIDPVRLTGLPYNDIVANYFISKNRLFCVFFWLSRCVSCGIHARLTWFWLFLN